jgi:hypothetical protein
MPEDRAKGPPSAFPELELDLGPVRSKRAAAAAADDDEPREVAIELDAPRSKRPELEPPAASLAPPSGPTSVRGPTSMGPPVSARGASASLGPPGSPSLGPPSTPMGPPPGYATGLASAAPPSGGAIGEPAAPSAASALMARARSAAQDPGAVARNVADVGNRTSTALVMLGGAILLTILDVVYSRVTGERFSIGPIKLVWIAAPLAFVGAIVLGVRLLKERLE